MPAAFEQTILDHRLLPIDSEWAHEIVFPYYNGLSIRNLAHTVIRLLDGKPSTEWLGSAPLDLSLWERYWGQTKRVLLFVSDGLGWRMLQEIVAQDPDTAQIVADLTGDGSLTPITSCVPSTTAAALPCIWTGAGPAATGMVGTRLFLREFGMLVSMLHYKPLVGQHAEDVLVSWGMDFNTFMPLQTLGEALAQRQIPVYLLLQKDLFGSGLSRIMHRGIQHAVRHFGYTDMWITLRDLLHETRKKRCLISVYWSAVDGISHLHGTVSEQAVVEIRRQLSDLRDALGSGTGNTLVLFTADHGHTPVPDYVDLSAHAPLADALRCGAGGEGRFSHLYLRHDFRQSVLEYLETTLSAQTACVIPSEALQAGLFGPELPHPETAARLGDLTVIARSGLSIEDRTPRTARSMSRHGGLSDREMLVPLLMRAL